MSLTNIYNERYGTSVAANDNYIAVGNPPTYDYNPAEGFYRIGEVKLIKRDTFNSNYSSSYTFTKSLNAQTIYSTRFGESVDLSDYFLAVGNSVLSASVTKGSFVDVYVVDSNYNVISGALVSDNNCVDESINTQTYSNKPMVTLTGSNSFGTSVSITNKYLAIGSPSENSKRGQVYIYQFSASKYKLESVLTPDPTLYPKQRGFGYSVSLDKKNQDRIVIGSNANVGIGESPNSLARLNISGFTKINRSFYNWYQAGWQGNGTYWHMKTNMYGGAAGNTMYTMSLFKGYMYSYSDPSVREGAYGFHNWSGIIYNAASTGNLFTTAYNSSDGFVVLVIPSGNGETGVTIDWHQAFGYPFVTAQVTAAGLHGATTGKY